MVEANPSLARSQRQAQRQPERMRLAVRVEAQRRAREEVKAKIRREGRVKLAACHRARSLRRRRPGSSRMWSIEQSSIAEAKAVVERWQWGHVVGCTQLETV